MRIVELLKAKVSGAQLVLMEDFQVPLTPQGREALAQVIQKLNRDGMAFMIATRILDHVTSIADRIVVMQKGRNLRTVFPDEYQSDYLLGLMLGHKFEEHHDIPETEQSREVYSIRDISFGGALILDRLTANSGEILGLLDTRGESNRILLQILTGEAVAASGASGLMESPLECGTSVFKTGSVLSVPIHCNPVCFRI